MNIPEKGPLRLPDRDLNSTNPEVTKNIASVWMRASVFQRTAAVRTTQGVTSETSIDFDRGVQESEMYLLDERNRPVYVVLLSEADDSKTIRLQHNTYSGRLDDNSYVMNRYTMQLNADDELVHGSVQSLFLPDDARMGIVCENDFIPWDEYIPPAGTPSQSEGEWSWANTVDSCQQLTESAFANFLEDFEGFQALLYERLH